MSSIYDTVIVGGGAAGLSGALLLGRARRRVAVIDAGAPRNAPASHMHGYLSRDGLPPEELLSIGRSEVEAYGVDLVSDRVDDVGSCDVADVAARFVVRLSSGHELLARRLLVTTGVVDALPDVPGLRERWGRDVLHCPYCHGWEVRGQALGVLDTGPGSVFLAQLVRQWSDDVTFFTHEHPVMDQERVELAARGIRIYDRAVARLEVGDDQLSAVVLADGSVVPRSAVFLRPSVTQRFGSPLLRLGCQFEADGSPVVDRDGRTSVPGVSAAGNVVDPTGQVIAAAGAANTAAIAINADLVAEDVATAVGRANQVEKSGGAGK